MRYRVGVRDFFSAAHKIEDHEGKCRELHGHTYVVEVELESNVLDRLDMVVDFNYLKKVLRTVLEEYDHKLLNDVLKVRNATSEVLARELLLKLTNYLYHVPVTKIKVRVYETPNTWVEVEL